MCDLEHVLRAIVFVRRCTGDSLVAVLRLHDSGIRTRRRLGLLLRARRRAHLVAGFEAVVRRDTRLLHAGQRVTSRTRVSLLAQSAHAASVGAPIRTRGKRRSRHARLLPRRSTWLPRFSGELLRLSSSRSGGLGASMSELGVLAQGVCKRFWVLRRERTAFRLARALANGERLHWEMWVLRDLSFEIRKGEKLALIGKNGSGKTTLLRILSGIYDKTSGILVLPEAPRTLFGCEIGFM